MATQAFPLNTADLIAALKNMPQSQQPSFMQAALNQPNPQPPTTRVRVPVPWISPPIPGPTGKPRRIAKMLPFHLPVTTTQVMDEVEVEMEMFDPVEIARSYFPKADADEIQHIIYGETGFPAFWNIPEDGKDALECFHKALRLALARREIRYRNVELRAEDPYAGTVEKIIAKSSVDIHCADGTIVAVNEDGKTVVVAASPTQNLKSYHRPAPRDWHPFVGASDVVTKFLEHAQNMGMTQDEFMKTPMEVFVNWLILQAAREDGYENPPLLSIEHKVLANV